MLSMGVFYGLPLYNIYHGGNGNGEALLDGSYIYRVKTIYTLVTEKQAFTAKANDILGSWDWLSTSPAMSAFWMSLFRSFFVSPVVANTWIFHTLRAHTGVYCQYVRARH